MLLMPKAYGNMLGCVTITLCLYTLQGHGAGFCPDSSRTVSIKATFSSVCDFNATLLLRQCVTRIHQQPKEVGSDSMAMCIMPHMRGYKGSEFSASDRAPQAVNAALAPHVAQADTNPASRAI
jgi:hypothetical protein